VRVWIFGAVFGSLVAAFACSSSTTNEASSGGTGGASTGGSGTGAANTGGTGTGGLAGGGGSLTGGNSGTGGGQSDGGPQCPSGMVAVGTTHCIDATEVTTGSYAKFLNDVADAGNITGNSGCSGVTDYAPASDTGCPVAPYTSDIQLPVRCVDWCSAYAYCKYAGKRLCGAVPKDSVDPSNATVKGTDQWYTACVGDGAPEDTYFYGPSFDDTLCQTSTAATKGPVNVGSKPDCKSHYFKGLVDMTGNIAEWEDSCDSATAATAKCLVRGGSHLDGTAAALSCASVQTAVRTERRSDVGFRCCWDSVAK